jgi:diguanylate cyclase
VFFSWTLAAAHMLFAVTCCMTVLALRPETPWWSGLVASGTTVGVGIVVGILSRFASDANVDVLTGLPNRGGFDRALNGEIAVAARNGSAPALIVLNLDRFHTINDMHGYRAGDEVLQHIVKSWLPLLGRDDTLARPDGDRFAVLLPNTTEQRALALADQLRATISMGCSAGVTSWHSGDSASLLVSRAEVALYRAKLTGGNRTVLESSGRAPLAIELADAIANGAVEVLYQPIVNLADSGTVVGIEALIRWASPSRLDVTTEEVVRVAEESGLIVELDKYVLRRACLDAHTMQSAKGGGPLTVHVNVSGLELAKPGYVEGVDRVLADTGWSPRQLVLEVTESVLDLDTPTAAAALHELRAPWHPHRHRRFRHRLLLVKQNPDPPTRPSQTRPIIHCNNHRRFADSAATAGHSVTQQRARSAGNRRRGRGCISGSNLEVPGLLVCARLLLRSTTITRGNRRHPGRNTDGRRSKGALRLGGKKCSALG